MAARNETSVLFTVDALRGAARVKTPEPELAPLSSAFVGADDEGVIDLKALASTPASAMRAPVAPLFSEPPPGAFATDVGSGAFDNASSGGGFKFGKRAIAGIAAAAVAVVLCSVGLAAAFRGEEPVARTSATSAMMGPITQPAPVVVAPAAPVVSPVTASDAPNSSSDDDAKSTPVKGKGKKGKGGAKASFAGTKVQSSGVASKSSKSSSSDGLVSKPAATPKAADKCGCKGDFTCVLRCTAKGS